MISLLVVLFWVNSTRLLSDESEQLKVNTDKGSRILILLVSITWND